MIKKLQEKRDIFSNYSHISFPSTVLVFPVFVHPLTDSSLLHIYLYEVEVIFLVLAFTFVVLYLLHLLPSCLYPLGHPSSVIVDVTLLEHVLFESLYV